MTQQIGIRYHKLLADYFKKFHFYYPQEEKKIFNTRKLSELPFQQINGALWNETYKTLTDFEFLESKNTCFSVYDLLVDFHYAIDKISACSPAESLLYIIEIFGRAIDQASIILKDNPELTFDQIINRIKWKKDHNNLLKEKIESIKKIHNRPWIEVLTRPDEISSLIRGFTGHTDEVMTCEYSPDKRFIVSASKDKTLKIWDARFGKEIYTLTGHTDIVKACSYSPDGSRIVSSGNDQTLKIWRTDNGKEVHTLKGHTNFVNGCAFSADGKFIVSASGDGTLKLWNALSGEEIVTLTGHNNPVRNCTFSADGKYIISYSIYNNTLKLWNVNSRTEISLPYEGHIQWHAIGFTASGDGIIYASFDNTIKLWDVIRKQLIPSLKDNGASSCEYGFIPINGCFVLASWDIILKILAILNTNKNSALKDYLKKTKIWAFSPDKKYVATADYNQQSVFLLNINNQGRSNTLQAHEKGIGSFVFSPDSRELLTAGSDGKLKLWDVTNEVEPFAEQRHAGEVLSCKFSPDSNMILSSGNDHTFKLWDVKSGTCIHSLKTYDPNFTVSHVVKDCTFSSDGKYIVSAGSSKYDHFMTIWYTKTGIDIGTLKCHNSYITTCSLSPDNTTLVSGMGDGTLEIWDMKKMRKVKTFKGHTDQINDCVFSLDGSQILSASCDKTLRLWDLEKGEELYSLTGHTDRINTCAYLQHRKQIISASSDNTIKIWDIKDHYSYSMKTVKLQADTFVISPDEKNIIFTGADGILRIWNLDKEKEVFKFAGFTGKINCLDISRNSNYIVLGDIQGQLLLLQLNNLIFSSSLITPYWKSKKIVYTCPMCQRTSKTNDLSAGYEVRCANCNALIRLNPVVIEPDQRRVKGELLKRFIREFDAQTKYSQVIL